jgi:hypothetical protein
MQLCPGCEQVPKGKGQLKIWIHVLHCMMACIVKELVVECAKVFDGKKCNASAYCNLSKAPNDIKTEKDAQEWNDHMKMHFNLDSPSSHLMCRTVTDDGICSSSYGGENTVERLASDAQVGQHHVHLQTQHGLVHVNNNVVSFCHFCDEFLIGHEAIELHFQEEHLGHLDKQHAFFDGISTVLSASSTNHFVLRIEHDFLKSDNAC